MGAAGVCGGLLSDTGRNHPTTPNPKAMTAIVRAAKVGQREGRAGVIGGAGGQGAPAGGSPGGGVSDMRAMIFADRQIRNSGLLGAGYNARWSPLCRVVVRCCQVTLACCYTRSLQQLSLQKPHPTKQRQPRSITQPVRPPSPQSARSTISRSDEPSGGGQCLAGAAGERVFVGAQYRSRR